MIVHNSAQPPLHPFHLLRCPTGFWFTWWTCWKSKRVVRVRRTRVHPKSNSHSSLRRRRAAPPKSHPPLPHPSIPAPPAYPTASPTPSYQTHAVRPSRLQRLQVAHRPAIETSRSQILVLTPLTVSVAGTTLRNRHLMCSRAMTLCMGALQCHFGRQPAVYGDR